MKWLAICSNGAISLGAFEAGAAAQIYADVYEINQRRPGNIGIDAVAGASAGAINCLLLAQAIGAGLTPDCLTHRLSEVWVNQLDIIKLVADQHNPANSLFDPGYVQKINECVVMDDHQMGEAGQASAAQSVVLSLALTNLDGIPYTIDVEGPQVVNSIFGDYETIAVDKGVPRQLSPVDTLKTNPTRGEPMSWDEVASLAVASGAFPFAFKSQRLDRDLTRYSHSIRPSNHAYTTSFNYSDGGLLDNCPIGRAIDAASYAEKLYGHCVDDHVFVVIEPDPTTIEDARNGLDALQPPFDENGLTPLKLLGEIGNTYFTSSFYKDLVNTTTINRQLKALQLLVTEGKITDGQLACVLEAVGLDYKKVVQIQRLVPGPDLSPLAGAFAGHLGGLFDERYRAYDFGAGCKTGRIWFEKWAEDNGLPKPIGALQRHPGEKPSPGGFAGVDPKVIMGARTKMTDRVESVVVRELNTKGLAKDLVGFVVHWLARAGVNAFFSSYGKE